jgi:hypothetical protein
MTMPAVRAGVGPTACSLDSAMQTSREGMDCLAAGGADGRMTATREIILSQPSVPALRRDSDRSQAAAAAASAAPASPSAAAPPTVSRPPPTPPPTTTAAATTGGGAGLVTRGGSEAALLQHQQQLAYWERAITHMVVRSRPTQLLPFMRWAQVASPPPPRLPSACALSPARLSRTRADPLRARFRCSIVADWFDWDSPMPRLF